jgi:hypothetical protein
MYTMRIQSELQKPSHTAWLQPTTPVDCKVISCIRTILSGYCIALKLI